MFFRKKEKPAVMSVNWDAIASNLQSDAVANIREPDTIATVRLVGKAVDKGADRAHRMYNQHILQLDRQWARPAKVIVEKNIKSDVERLQMSNQWVNPYQSINTGFGTAQLTYFLYQTVNYYECMSLSQDPILNKVFSLLSETPLAKGGKLADRKDIGPEQMEEIEKAAKRFNINPSFEKALRSSYVQGGCLLYLDFGSDENLEEPLNLATADLRRFQGFRHIDPINCCAVSVNTIEPAAADYMKPSKWYIVGLGVVHATRFLKFEANVPELMLRPLCMYFGMPLTQLIKQDIANITLTTQGLANIVNKTRDTFLKMDVGDLASAQAQVNARLKILALTRDNNTITPIKQNEDVVQLSYSLAGFAEAGEFICQMLSAKTDIPLTELMGKTAQGMNATGEGDRRAWYDRVRRIQTNNKPQYLKMWGIVAGIALQTKFVEFDDFIFSALEEASEREKTEIAKANIDMAIALIREVGAKRESVFEWLKANDDLHLANVELDLMEEGEFPDFDPTDPDDDPLGGLSVKNDGFDENKHKRDKGGRFTSGGKQDKQESSEKVSEDISDSAFRKIKEVKIDFSKDNILPELEPETLEKIGISENKPVLLKKSVIERNKSIHADVKETDYDRMLGQCLYAPEIVSAGNRTKPYFNFVSRIGADKSSVVLLEVEENKGNFEIVHLHFLNDKKRRTIERKGERIKKEKG